MEMFMKRIWLVTLLAVFVFTASATVASAATTNGLGANHSATAVHTLNAGSIAGSTATYLVSFQSSKDKKKDRDEFKDKDKGRGKDKDKFHGAEMSSTAILIAGLFAISAYFLFVRRKSQHRA
jgi:long-subunit fatty acid transport protein